MRRVDVARANAKWNFKRVYRSIQLSSLVFETNLWKLSPGFEPGRKLQM